jgi:N-acetylmuramic acid 6-phosphate etherase
METLHIERPEASTLLESADGHVKTAIVMSKLGVDVDEARTRLEAVGGLVGRIVPDLGV